MAREPGVLMLYALRVRGQPTQRRLVEIYADEDAYRAHLQSEHFLKYKTGTEKMVRSLRLIETDPLLLRSRQRRGRLLFVAEFRCRQAVPARPPSRDQQRVVAVPVATTCC